MGKVCYACNRCGKEGWAVIYFFSVLSVFRSHVHRPSLWKTARLEYNMVTIKHQMKKIKCMLYYKCQSIVIWTLTDRKLLLLHLLSSYFIVCPVFLISGRLS